MENKQQYKVNISAPNLMNICIDANDNGELRGRLYHCYKEEPVSFQNVVQLVVEMEGLCDSINFPQASTKTRSFIETKSVYGERPPKLLEQTEIIRHTGEKGTFITHIKFRQNSTWQGEIFWAEQDAIHRFADTLSFLKIVDGALSIKNK